MAYLRGGGFGGSNPHPTEIFRFFFEKWRKSGRKKMKRDVGGGGEGLIVNIFFWVEIISSGVEIYSGGLRNFRSGLRNFSWGGGL